MSGGSSAINFYMQWFLRYRLRILEKIQQIWIASEWGASMGSLSIRSKIIP